ncbi:MAG: hypothetical protein GC206_09065 [Alphaproteobacteria bacterium]|nr:hypothetical protein [Alphaproteobacteria bacterium]
MSGSGPKPARRRDETKLTYTGFSVGGVDWLWMDLVDAPNAEERRKRLNTIGYEEARLTHELGGNLLRLFFSFAALVENLAPQRFRRRSRVSRRPS